MKNALKLTALFLLVTLSFTSCNKSDDNGGGTSGNIVAKWNFSKIGSIINGQEVLTDYPNEAGCAKDNTQFKADGTEVSTQYNSSCVASTSSGTYTKSGDTLTVTEGGDTTTATILQLDDTTLKIKETETSGGTTTTYIVVFTKG